MPKFVSMDLYQQYKQDVWRLTNAGQRLEPGRPQRGLTDQEIAAELGLAVEDVTEIRCIAENEMIPLEAYLDADKIKQDRFKKQ